MNQKSEEGLFEVLEKELKKRKDDKGNYAFIDCNELYDRSMAVRDHASSPSRVSDYLGHLWRKGKLMRVPAPAGTGVRSRWLYAWKGNIPTPVPDLSQAVAYDPALGKVLDKPNLHIEEEDGTVIITLPDIVITIKQRNRGD